MPAPLVLLALGGNALIKDRSHMTVPDQYASVVETSRRIVCLLERGYNLVITHGNGPQVGFILRRSELSRHELHPVPLDSCVADSQGAIGYNIQMALDNELAQAGIARTVVSLVTQVVVDAADPAFSRPSKPIGSFLSEEEARTREAEGWQVVEDAGRGWRRVVASPLPRDIIEIEAIRALVDRGVIVVAAGGGGIPVVRDEAGRLRGVEAVVDKDLASSLLARRLHADLMMIATAVPDVRLSFGKPDERPIPRMTAGQAERYAAQGEFAAGSMLPKILATIEFVRATGNPAMITSPECIALALDGEAGTLIVPDGDEVDGESRERTTADGDA